PAAMRVGAFDEEVVDLHSFVSQTAAFWIRRVVEMRTNGDESARAPIIDARFVRRFEGETAATEIRVIDADHRRPVTVRVVNALHDGDARAISEVAELARHDLVVGFAGERLEVIQDDSRGAVGLRIGWSGRRALNTNSDKANEKRE